MRGWMLLVLAGCGSAKLAIRLGDVSKVENDGTVVLGECVPTKRVMVTSTAGTPVAGALVVVRQVEHTNCPSAAPATPLLTTAPVRTDSQGVATTCDPDRFAARSQPSFCPSHVDPPTVVVIAGDQGAQLTAPFAPELRVTLAPCAQLVAQNPDFPCPKESL